MPSSTEHHTLNINLEGEFGKVTCSAACESSGAHMTAVATAETGLAAALLVACPTSSWQQQNNRYGFSRNQLNRVLDPSSVSSLAFTFIFRALWCLRLPQPLRARQVA